MLVPITPCRLVDTRTDAPVGDRTSPLTAAEVVRFGVWNMHGNCDIPPSATGVSTNVTIDNPTSASYLTVYPADAPSRPLSSNLNWTASSSPTPNQVTVGLSADGALNVYNNAGSVDVIIDVVGYYEAAGSDGAAAGPAGPTGPAGPPGPQGPVGPTGPAGTGASIDNVVWVAKSGGQFTSVSAALASITDATASNRYVVMIAPGVYSEQVTVKSFVDLQGAGEGTTILSFTGGAADPASTGDSATLRAGGSADAAIRDLTIESVATSQPHALAVYLSYTTPSLRFDHVTMRSSRSGTSTTSTALYNFGGHSSFEDIALVAGGGGTQSVVRALVNLDATGPGPMFRSLHATATGTGTAQVRGIDSNSWLDVRDADVTVNGTINATIGVSHAGSHPMLIANSTILTNPLGTALSSDTDAQAASFGGIAASSVLISGAAAYPDGTSSDDYQCISSAMIGPVGNLSVIGINCQ